MGLHRGRAEGEEGTLTYGAREAFVRGDTETVVQWVLGTRPNGKYLSVNPGGSELTENREAAEHFLTEKAAKEALALSVPADLRGMLRAIRVSRTTRESCDG